MQPTTVDNSSWNGTCFDTIGLNLAVHTEQIRLLSPQRPTVLANILVACAVGIAIGWLYPAWLVMLWLALFFIVTLARFVLQFRYEISTRGSGATARWARGFVLGALVTGCLWGLTGSVVLVTSHAGLLYFLSRSCLAAWWPAVLSAMPPISRRCSDSCCPRCCP